MKKFYSTIALALTASMAFAAGTTQPQKELQFRSLSQPVDINMMQDNLDAQKASKKPAKTPISNVQDIYSNYVWFAMSVQDATGTIAQSEIAVYPTGNANEVYLSGLNNLTDELMKGTVNPTTGVITVPNGQYIARNIQIGGLTGTHNIVLALGTVDEEGYISFKPTDLELTWEYDDESQLPQLVPGDFYDIIAYQVEGYDGLIDGYIYSSFYRLNKHLSNERGQFTWAGWDEFDYINSWKDAGTANIKNIWLSNYDYVPVPNGADNYQVKYQLNTENPNLIRLVNPYGEGTPWASINESAAEGAVIIDVEDPACVCVFQGFTQELPYVNGNGRQYEGEIGNSTGLIIENLAYYFGNYEGYYRYVLGASTEEIMDEFPDAEFSTFKDNVIYIPNPTFGQSFYPAYPWDSWENRNGDVIYLNPITITLDSAGVESIGSDNNNAPVKYYNLQGVQIMNPEKGQLVIRHQGNETSKYIVK